MLHRFFIKTPKWAKQFFPSYVWHIPSKEKIVYLTFDDGPHPSITPWVLNELKAYNAKATFFCIGDNVLKFPETYNELTKQGHSVGNHTQRHLNGWKTDKETYLKDVAEAAKVINANLFRPPYGKLKSEQAKGLSAAMQRKNLKVIMWDVLSADFDAKTSPETCIKNVLKNVAPGSIVVFHDSEKAFRNLKASLPVVLKTLKEEGYKFGKISMESL
ncbi:polysaccharide deacetylase family protein [Flavisolibacter ginsenosidimutans]|uniref:Polysaccharide deacetylase family protein n=1 Tax=Flavisolibacter ginsenosidimutans TaxID=661481 RepID=A0A5B8UKX7_9BACT|nr:polysaccharide deacetylase family protein [Flavisolibacter ginsenosidimutans]QEC56839.1 polysaccharide deacetylase family protein [Flavisolibacter ginsenosidimutans]